MRTLLALASAGILLAGCAPSVELTTNAGPSPSTVSGSPTAVPSSGSVSVADPSPSPSPSSTLRAVFAPTGSFVLGDSISLGVAPFLARLGFPVVGRVGQSATEDYLRTYLSTPQAQEAPAWVLILGTNNPGDPADVARIGDLLDVVDSLRDPSSPQDVFWVTPYRDPRYSGGLSDNTLDAFGAELATQASARPWLHVVDFAAAAAFHPEWFDDDGSHLHPDDRGYGALAALVAGPDAVPMLTPAPVQTLDGPTPLATPSDDGPAHPTARATPRATPTDAPSPTRTTASTGAASPQEGAAPTDAPATAVPDAPAAQEEFSPAS